MKTSHFLIGTAVLLSLACGPRNDQTATGTASPASGTYSPAPSTTSSASTSASFSATVVAIDPANGSVTLREVVAGAPAGGTGDLRAGDRTLKTEGSATASLANVKVGEEVTIVCTPTTAPAAGSTTPAGSGTAMGSSTATGTLASCAAVVSIAPAMPAR